MTTDNWLMWQLADSAFPAGGLAHSNGLEAAVEQGLVTNGASLEPFIAVALGQCVRGTLGFVRAAWRTPAKFDQIDHQCDLFLNNHVTNRASRAQGRAFLAAATRIFATPAAIQLTEKLRASRSPNHLAPVFGLVLASLPISEQETQSLFLFVFVRGCISSAVRLGVVGPLEGQRIQSRIQVESKTLDLYPIQTAPVLDLLQGTQDRLYSRLFQS
jgi:urease accessory protein